MIHVDNGYTSVQFALSKRNCYVCSSTLYTALGCSFKLACELVLSILTMRAAAQENMTKSIWDIIGYIVLFFCAVLSILSLEEMYILG